MKRFLVFLTALATFLGFQGRALATHYRSSTIHWSVPGSDAPTTVLFTVTYGLLTASPPPLRSVTIDFGDGTDSGPIVGAVVGTATDAQGTALDVREATVLHTYAGPGTYTAAMEDCCRIGTLVNGGGQPYRVSSIVTLQPGNTGGPVTGSLPVVQLPLGGERTFEWPVIDPDGDPITCRFGTDAEAGFAGSVPIVPSPGPGLGGQAPALASYPDGCQLGWDLADAAAGQKFTVHLVFQSDHDGAFSTTELDLIVEIVTAPTPQCDGSGTFTADVGQVLSVPVTGSHALATPLTAAIIGAPGATLSPGGSGPSPFANTFAWTPQPIDAGTAHVILVRYTSAMHLSGACALTVLVPGCPGAAAPCSAGIGECAEAGVMLCTGDGGVACSAVPGAPAAEECDGKDNDCDGAIDDGDPEGGQGCSTGLPGVCDAGLTACIGGDVECVPVTSPGAASESCNGADDDCDGEVDEGFPLGETCGVGMGQCASFGAVVCAADGGTACDAIAGEPSDEVCGDGLDQDCDGVVDDGCSGTGGSGGAGAGGSTGGEAGGGATGTTSTTGGTAGAGPAGDCGTCAAYSSRATDLRDRVAVWVMLTVLTIAGFRRRIRPLR